MGIPFTMCLLLLCPKGDSADTRGLSLKEELLIRKLVYEDPVQTAFPRDNEPWSNLNILVIPENVSVIYSKKPAATLLLFETILTGANPREAAIAAAYGLSLASNPTIGPSILAIPKRELDAPITGSPERTFRHLLIDRLRSKRVRP